ncbi:MAG: threonine synthase [Bacteroidia bacterium]|nr:threonine synthase [Bacteroidia bacterium]
MSEKPHFICQSSGESYPLESLKWQGAHGALLDLEHSNRLDLDAVKSSNDYSLWRYQSGMGLPKAISRVSFAEGFSPLVRLEVERQAVEIKLDYLFPSGSYKDRGATALISLAKHLGVNEVVQDSSGNAGAAIANYCALAGISCRIFVPANTSPAKLVQISSFGAQIELVEGSREMTAQAAREAAADTFYASHVWNPIFYEGTKTFAYEICEQRAWRVPDAVVLPAGNGTLLIGAYIGFNELKDWGIIQKLPKLVGVQASNCAPLYHEFHGLDPQSNQPTYAEGIAIAIPGRAQQMLDAVRKTGGTFIKVTEGEIAQALKEAISKGYFIEPTSAAVFAGLKNYLREYAGEGEEVVSVFTGNGLKSSEKIQKILKK